MKGKLSMQFWHFFLSHFIFLRIYYCPFSLLCCAHTHQIYGSRAMHFVCVCFVHCTSIVFTFAAGAFSNVYKCIRVKRTMALYTTHEHTRTHNYKLNDKSLDKNYGIIFGTRMSELNYVCVYLLVLLSIYADAVCASAKVTWRIVFILFFLVVNGVVIRVACPMSNSSSVNELCGSVVPQLPLYHRTCASLFSSVSYISYNF